MTIRECCSQDEQEVKRLFLEYCAAMREVGDAERFWVGRPQPPHGTVLVLETEGVLGGFGSLLLSPLAVSPFVLGVTQMFYVEPSVRRYSGLMMRAGLRYYRQHGCRKATMFCTDRAYAFWAKHRYRPLATLMERSL